MFKISPGEQWKVPGNQCIREIQASMAIHPYKGNCVPSEVTKRFKEYQTPLLSCFQPVDLKKFSGGRVAVQDSSIAEVFYRDDKYPEIRLGNEQSFLQLKGSEIVVSAIKKSEVEDSLIIRIFNTSDQMNKFSIKFNKSISKLSEVDLRENEKGSIGINDNESDEIQIRGKEILSGWKIMVLMELLCRDLLQDWIIP